MARSRLEVAKVDDLFPQLDAEPIAHGGTAAINERANVAGARGAVVHDEIAVHGRDPRAANSAVLHARAIDERAGRPRNPLRHDVAAAFGVLKDAAGAGRIERLRALPERERLA